jgi:uncharacterized membrane protein
MSSEKFRRQLQQESQLWLEEGLIDEEIYQQLAQRYQFNLIISTASDRFVVILLVLGSILLGLGVITFIAANWQQWSKLVKTIFLLLLLITSNCLGFYFWRQPAKMNKTNNSPQRLGQGLLWFGALLLGANLANLAQIFHLSANDSRLYLLWGIGVLAMAYGLRLTSLGILSLILCDIGYWWGVLDLTWWSQPTLDEWTIQHFFIVSLLFLLPLAYWCNSRALFVLSCLMAIPALIITGNMFFTAFSTQPISLAITPALAIAFLWGYDDTLLPSIHSYQFKPLARSLAVWLLGIVFFCFSFRVIWLESVNSAANFAQISSLTWWLAIDLILATIWTIREWINLFKNYQANHHDYLDFSTIVITGFILISLLVIYVHFSIYSLTNFATFIFNLQLFILAIGLIKQGLAQGKRLNFWGGMILLALQILSRTLEYDTGLIFKSLIFILCGIAVIFLGLWFEKHLKFSSN